MRITSWFVDRPCTVIGIGLFALIIVSVLAVVLGYFERTEQHRREYLIWDDQMTKNYDMQTLAKEAISKSKGKT